MATVEIKSNSMNGIDLSLIAAGCFLLGVGLGHIVPFVDILATVGVILIALGLVVFFWKPSFMGKTQKISKGRN